MENTMPVRQPRSLVRRLALPVCFSIATLAGAGWGVYHYTVSPGSEVADPPSEVAHSAPTSNDRLRDLFTTQSPQSAAPGATNQAYEETTEEKFE